jgi:fibrillarin-like pre-rRNA processing protein
MQVIRLFDGVYRLDGRLATRNLVRGRSVYGERLVEHEGVEYRLWNPYRSKLASAIINGLSELGIKRGSKVLYLGAATGTTASHVSDIVGKEGIVCCVEIAERSMRELLKVCESRPNMLPVLQDARNVEAYADAVKEYDVIYQDIAARDQAEILSVNAALLKEGGFAYVAIKSQSIDVARRPELVYREFMASIEKRYDVLQTLPLVPFTKMHLFAALRKKREQGQAI